MNHPVEQRFSPEPSACQHQRHENARYQARVIAQSATRKLRCTAVASSGDRWSHSAISAITGDRRPDAERLQRSLAVFSGRHPIRIGDSQPTVAERLGEREIRRDPESMVLLLGAINTS